MFDVFANLPKKENDEIVSLAIRLPKQMREDFAALCAKHEVDVSVVVRELIKSQLELAKK